MCFIVTPNSRAVLCSSQVLSLGPIRKGVREPQCCRDACEPQRYAEAMKKDANDGKPWTEMDVRGLMAAQKSNDADLFK